LQPLSAGCNEKQLIHKDVKPANVLINTATGQARLMGFGIASRLPRERLNRSIDSRSDLYALGVTLYEMATGTLPFNSFRSDGTAPLPYRAPAGAARRAVERDTGPGFGNRDEIARQDD
jgi:serine/threonine protein kinase